MVTFDEVNIFDKGNIIQDIIFLIIKIKLNNYTDKKIICK